MACEGTNLAYGNIKCNELIDIMCTSAVVYRLSSKYKDFSFLYFIPFPFTTCAFEFFNAIVNLPCLQTNCGRNTTTNVIIRCV